MTTSVELQNTELNQFPILRYDVAHEIDRGPAEEDYLFGEPLFGESLNSGSADMDVSGAGSVSGAFPVPANRAAVPQNQPTQSPAISSPTDELEISDAARMMESLPDSEVRAARLAQIRAEIEAGTYDTDAKLEAALGRMLQSLDEDV